MTCEARDLAWPGYLTATEILRLDSIRRLPDHGG